MASKPHPDYALGRTVAEHKRLEVQGAMLAPMTRRFFEAAGISSGMRVLDLGCGVGDVSLLAAEMVGPQGSVTSFDVDEAALSRGRERASKAGIANIEFCCADISQLGEYETFDAVVGRYVLLYVPDPLETIRAATRAAKPGGIVGFQELMYWPIPAAMVPQLPLGQKVGYWIMATLQRSGAHVEVGNQMYWLMLDAGLPAPKVRMEGVIQPGADSPLLPYIVDTMRNLLPKAVEHGIVSHEEVDISTLEDRLRHEHVTSRTLLSAAWSYWAWAAKPYESA